MTKALAERIEAAINSPDNIGMGGRKVFSGTPEDWQTILAALRSPRGEVPKAWLVLQCDDNHEVVPSPLTDDTVMFEGDEAWPIHDPEFAESLRALATEQPAAHEWDASGERCLKCGDKDWMAGPVCAPRPSEPFVVKHYTADERPSIKGNGFDGLSIGEEREEAEEFVRWINARLAAEQGKEPK